MWHPTNGDWVYFIMYVSSIDILEATALPLLSPTLASTASPLTPDVITV